ncbi:MAG: transposase [Gammaproteobacteria bacterium]
MQWQLFEDWRLNRKIRYKSNKELIHLQIIGTWGSGLALPHNCIKIDTMARPLRIELAGGIYHVTTRGDRLEDIYQDDKDRQKWLAVLEQVCERYNWICHGYCQMTNHYHLIIETVEGNLSKGMRQLNGVYTQYHNRRHDRVGHVYHGRYKAILVEKDSYLLELSRYVVLNPVRAGMVKHAGAWSWSSYRAMIDKAPAPAWLQVDWLLSQFSKQRKRAIDKYKDFVRAGLDQTSIWSALSQQIYLGSDEFIAKMQKAIVKDDALDEVPKIQSRPVVKPITYYLNRYRDPREGMAHAFLTGAYTQSEIAKVYNVHYATVSRAVKWLEAKRK